MIIPRGGHTYCWRLGHRTRRLFFVYYDSEYERPFYKPLCVYYTYGYECFKLLEKLGRCMVSLEQTRDAFVRRFKPASLRKAINNEQS